MMAKVVINILGLQGSVVIQTVLGGPNIPRLQISSSVYVPKILKIGWQLTKLLQKLVGLLFWPPLYIAVHNYSP